MRRYIYTSIGVLVIIVGIVIIGLINQAKPSENAPTPYNPTATSKATETPVPTTTAPSPTNPSTEPTEAPTVDPEPVEPVETAAPVINEQTGEEVGSASILKKNPDGTIYFVDSETGEKQDDSIYEVKDNGTSNTPIGRGSDIDKKNAANSFLKYTNALHESNWAEACNHMQMPETFAKIDCEQKLAQRASTSPAVPQYVLADTAGNDVDGDKAVVVGSSIKDTNGNFGGNTLMHRTSNPEIWLVDGQQLLDIK